MDKEQEATAATAVDFAKWCNWNGWDWMSDNGYFGGWVSSRDKNEYPIPMVGSRQLYELYLKDIESGRWKDGYLDESIPAATAEKEYGDPFGII